MRLCRTTGETPGDLRAGVSRDSRKGKQVSTGSCCHLPLLRCACREREVWSQRWRGKQCWSSSDWRASQLSASPPVSSVVLHETTDHENARPVRES